MSKAWDNLKAQNATRWLTNDSQAAHALNDAETNFEKRKRAAEHLPLTEKIVAIREARKQLARDYDTIINATKA